LDDINNQLFTTNSNHKTLIVR